MLKKIEIYFKKKRWSAIIFINNSKKATQDNKQSFSYSFKNHRSPPQVKDLIQFENDSVRIVRQLKF